MKELYYLEATRCQMLFGQIRQYRLMILILFWMLALAGLLTSEHSLASTVSGGGGEGDEEAAEPIDMTNNLGNTAFQSFYNFVYGAATGNLGRGIALTGGIIGLGFGAASGRALPAVVGIVLAMFGALGPTIIVALFNSAII